MKLTGKCKEDFEKWYESLEDFYHLDIMPENMVYGVYEDFFDSVGIDIRILENNVSSILNTDGFSQDRKYDYSNETRQEAREQAILKANEIYNEL